MGAVEAPVGTDELTVLASPCAVYDSTTATASGLAGPVTGAETPRTIKVTGTLTGQGGDASCVPSGASSVVFTISAINPQSGGNLRLSAEGVVPNGGVVNYVANGLNNANTVTVPVNDVGEVDIKSNVGTTDVRLVAIGFYSATPGLTYFPVTPCAASDSRSNQGAGTGFVGPFCCRFGLPRHRRGWRLPDHPGRRHERDRTNPELCCPCGGQRGWS